MKHGICIFGSYDGMTLNGSVAHLTVAPPVEMPLVFLDTPTTQGPAVEIYDFKRIEFPDGRQIGMWILEGRTEYDAITRLIDAYAKPL